MVVRAKRLSEVMTGDYVLIHVRGIPFGEDRPLVSKPRESQARCMARTRHDRNPTASYLATMQFFILL